MYEEKWRRLLINVRSTVRQVTLEKTHFSKFALPTTVSVVGTPNGNLE